MVANKSSIPADAGQPKLDKYGHEVPDPRPLSVPSGFRRPETLAEQVQRLVRTSISRQAEEQGLETFEDSEDFDIPDDPDDPTTQYEEWFDPTLGRAITAQEFKDNFEVYRQRFLDAEAAAYVAMDRSDALRRPFREDPVDPGARASRAASERVSSEAPNPPPAPKNPV